MSTRCHFAAAAGLALLISSAVPAVAQHQLGTPVDRNVGDTGPNSASQRIAQPGLGQFGVGSLLLDRFGDNNNEPQRYNGYTGDPRVSQRYLLQTPGITALIDRPDYIGVSPGGGWARNSQTIDGTEILTLTPANTVYVLSPELLQPQQRRPISPVYQIGRADDHTSRVHPRTFGDPYAIMRNAQVDHQAYTTRPGVTPTARDENYRHPAIIERQRRLREERAAEQAKREAQAQDQAQAQAQAEHVAEDQAADDDADASDATGQDEAAESKPAS